MNIRIIRDLALKVLGFYYLSHALISASQLGWMFTTWGKMPEMAGHEIAVVLPALLGLCFWVVIGLVLTFRTSLVVALLWPLRPEEQDTTATANRPTLRFWIVLVGFFYFVGSLGRPVSQLWVFAAGQQMRGSFSYYRWLPDLITLALSIFCMTKAGAIETFLMRQIGKDSQQNPEVDSSTRVDTDLGTPQE